MEIRQSLNLNISLHLNQNVVQLISSPVYEPYGMSPSVFKPSKNAHELILYKPRAYNRRFM